LDWSNPVYFIAMAVIEYLCLTIPVARINPPEEQRLEACCGGFSLFIFHMQLHSTT
jgi:hypothetical protein